MSEPTRSRLRVSDLMRLGIQGLRAHPMRATLSALGIAIGIAAMISVIGISMSSEAKVQEKLAALGTNQLTVQAGKSITGEQAKLPADSPERLKRVEGVTEVGWIAELKDVGVYRNGFIDPGETSGLKVAAAGQTLPEATSATLARGVWLNEATSQYPVTVLGATAAKRLGITVPGSTVTIDGKSYTVAGLLAPSPLAPELDTMALIGQKQAASDLGFAGHPTTIYERSAEDRVGAIRELIPATVSPQAPGEVQVSRPSDALAAQNTIDQEFTGLLVGVGSIALLVGGIGVANTMVITVLERRREIGLRRSLGATRRHIRHQFLVEAVLLSAYGGLVGAVLGIGITAGVAAANGWTATIPPAIVALGIGVTIIVGAIAGMLPAMRAAKVSPTEALAA
ncbi:ABC transporter permease [Leucobacter sp. HY1910]